MRLYNLSPTPYALSNIALRRLKISRLSDLNDPFELLAADLLNPLQRKAFADWKQELSQSTGLICFSKSWRNPLLWGHYADRHSGIALGFEVPDSLPVDVVYSATRVKIPTEAMNDNLVLDEALMNRLLRTKFEDWRYEDESRVFVKLDHSTREAGMYFQNFGPDLALAEVVLGPNCDLPIDRVRVMVNSAHPGVRVAKARMAYRSFHIVEDRAFRRSKGRG
jgi:hypothetical protein